MIPSSQALLDTVVASLKTDPDLFALPVYPDSNDTERLKPCIIVSQNQVEAPHRNMRVIEMEIEYLANRHDVAPGDLPPWQQRIYDHLEEQAFIIATALYELGWQVGAFSMTTPFSEESGEDDWRTGFEYRLSLLKV
jgi:hypothetical protein